MKQESTGAAFESQEESPAFRRGENVNLPPRQVRYVLARDQHRCTRCNRAAVAVVMRYTPQELHALHRDPANPDNWRASCVEHLDAM